MLREAARDRCSAQVVKDKGFGFIIPDSGGDEVFFHRSRLAPKTYFEELREGTDVQFEVRSGEKAAKPSICG